MHAQGTNRSRTRLALAAVSALVVSVAAAQCSKSPTSPTPATGGGPSVPGPSGPTTPVPTPGPEIFVGAGDIANCDVAGGSGETTARLLDGIGGTVFTLGDNAYPNGSRANYADCYNKSWGRHIGRTRPAPGNHEYQDGAHDGAAYFDYFGDQAGPRGLGYYSYDVGAWHVISLNSNAPEPGVTSVSDAASGPQGRWLQADLAANKTKCTLAYWHHPLFSSGRNGNQVYMHDFFALLYDANADVVLSGHDHLYERFGPQTADGAPDPARGIVEFVVGTGGTKPMYPFMTQRPNSLKQITDRDGVLKMTLFADSYSWEFVTSSGVVDSGGPIACH